MPGSGGAALRGVPHVAFEPADETLSRAVAATLAELAGEDVAARLASADPSLWGPDAEAEASVRLGWLALPESSQVLIPVLDRLRDEVHAAGLDHVVLAGMGGSSLAPEVIARSAGVELTVLDTTDPLHVRRALTERLDRTIVVVASKSGTTVETDSHRRAYEQAFRDAGLGDDLGRRFVMVTDPGTPLEAYARENDYGLVTADPNVGGRYSALSAFGLVPSVLAGVDPADMLDDAADLLHRLAKPTDNLGLFLGAILGAAWRCGRDKIVLAAGPGLPGFGDWAEQLIAESTGKAGRGLLPVVVEGPDAPGFAGAGRDALLVSVGEPVPGAHVGVSGPLGAQFLLWEYAVAVAGRLIGINPFDQPNVQESKDNTNVILAEGPAALRAEGDLGYEDEALAIHTVGPRIGEGHRGTRFVVRGVLRDLVGAEEYLAIMAYLDRVSDAGIAALRPELARHLAPAQVTFGWGPRYLHSTGQYHKGGPQTGGFLQITGAVDGDLPVPGRPYTFGILQQAQAAGDRRALQTRGRPIVHIHLKDRATGVRALLDAVGGGSGTLV